MHESGERLAVHAGALSSPRGVVLLAGRSGSGKTTLSVSLALCGLGLLSDELAVIETETGRVLPYRRSIHVREETVGLVPELAFLRDRPRQVLGGGIEWALRLDELERSAGLRRPTGGPLASVVVLDGQPDGSREPRLTPIPPAIAVVDLLRQSWMASIDFEGTMRTLLSHVAGCRCARLESGALDETVDLLLGWLGQDTRA
jgi:hypothetical protein